MPVEFRPAAPDGERSSHCIVSNPQSFPPRRDRWSSEGRLSGPRRSIFRMSLPFRAGGGSQFYNRGDASGRELEIDFPCEKGDLLRIGTDDFPSQQIAVGRDEEMAGRIFPHGAGDGEEMFLCTGIDDAAGDIPWGVFDLEIPDFDRAFLLIPSLPAAPHFDVNSVARDVLCKDRSAERVLAVDMDFDRFWKHKKVDRGFVFCDLDLISGEGKAPFSLSFPMKRRSPWEAMMMSVDAAESSGPAAKRRTVMAPLPSFQVVSR